MAPTDEEAVSRAKALYRASLVELVREHQEHCAQVRAAGMIPRAATNATARALKILGIEDPANDLNTVLQRRQDNNEVASLKEQLSKLEDLVKVMAAGAVHDQDGPQQPQLEGLNEPKHPGAQPSRGNGK